MASSPPPPPQNTTPRASGGLSLYANLLQTETSAATGGGVKAPIMFQAAGTAAPDTPANKINPSTLRFQPTRRHNPNAKKVAPKGITIKHSVSTAATAGGNTPAVPVTKSTLEDWANTGHSDDDLDNFYAHKQQEKERRKKKRKKNKDMDRRHIDWDDTYDPERPNVYDDYKDGEEKFREIEDWKNKLYGRVKDSESEGEEDARPVLGGGRGFAPPASFAPPSSFAPPATYGSGSASPPTKRSRSPSPYRPPQPAAEVPDDPTGEDAYARRVRLSLQASGGVPLPPPIMPSKAFSPPPHHRSPTPPRGLGVKRSPTPPRHSSPPPPQPAPPVEATISRAPVRYTQPTDTPVPVVDSAAVISRAPVRYNKPSTPEPESKPAPKSPKSPNSPPKPRSPSPPRTTLPGQKGFAQRLLAKYGWTSGTGLGASQSGIVQPLQAVVKKNSAGHGKIIDRNRKKQKKAEVEEESESDKLSSVVVLDNMLDGLPEEDVHSADLRQDIGEECQACGIVERVVIHAPEGSGEDEGRRRVFVKFTSEVSALRAVQKMNGRIFGGNKIVATYYDAGKFEKAEYE